MAKQARAQVTREAIIQAAARVFSAQSYATATLGDVIRGAGITQGALYFHFESKKALALEVIKRQHATSLTAGTAFLNEDRPGMEAMVLLSRELVRQITEDPIVRGGLRLSTESAHEFPEYASRPYLDWIATCTEFVERAVAAGDVVSSPESSVIARFIISAFTGVQTVSQATTQWEDVDERLDEMWAFISAVIIVPDRRTAFAAALRPAP